ncbi:MAG: hypothetical protein KF900_11610 [Bacteroidetes bacterium]|nr:hypothetical protein [Bacteroidota bacterium]
MKFKITFGVIVAVIAFTSACKKQKNETPSTPAEQEPVVYPDYAALKVGNYWIYGRYQLDQQNNITDLNSTDSCYIEKDTVIRGQTYYKRCSYDFIYQRHQVAYLRDSLHYMINSAGGIFFSSQDFSTVFSTSYKTGGIPPETDTLYTVTRKMNDKDFVVTVPAGTFTTSNMQIAYLTSGSYTNANIDNPRYMNTRYAKGVGTVSETEQFFPSVPHYTERRLLRYHVK